MRSLSDKAMFRDILENLFLELTERYDKLHADLEARVRDELPPPLERLTIVTGVARREGLDPEHNFLSPMVEGEGDESPRPAAAIAREALAREGEYRVGTVFLAADYLLCRDLARERERYFQGTILSGEERAPARFQIRPAARYWAPVEKLCQLFQANQLPWRTVNAPYLTKFFDVILVGDGDTEIPEGELGFEVEAERYQGALRHGLIPIWNVARSQARGDEFPAPVEGALNYEYRF
jgi:hypothetical protein